MPRRPWPPGIKISVQMPSDPSADDLQFVNQLGCRYVNIGTSGGAAATYENFVRLKNKVESAGLRVWNIGNTDVHNMEAVTINLPGRDKKIEEYKSFIAVTWAGPDCITPLMLTWVTAFGTQAKILRAAAPRRACSISPRPKDTGAEKNSMVL